MPDVNMFTKVDRKTGARVPSYVYDKETGARLLRAPVDAREMVRMGRYQYEPVEGKDAGPEPTVKVEQPVAISQPQPELEAVVVPVAFDEESEAFDKLESALNSKDDKATKGKGAK